MSDLSSGLFSLITICFIFFLGCVTINSLVGSVSSYHEVCPLCFQEQEVDAHLFMHCPLVFTSMVCIPLATRPLSLLDVNQWLNG